MSYKEQFSNTIEMAYDIIMTTIQESMKCKDLAETTGFVTLAFVIGFITLLGFRTSSTRWALVLVFEDLICRSQTVETLLEEHMLPRLSNTIQRLIDYGQVSMSLTLVLLVFALTLCILCQSISPAKVPTILDNPNDTLVVGPKDWHTTAAANRNWHGILGIPVSASEAQINHELRRRAWQCHPDKTRGNASLTEVYRICIQTRQKLVEQPVSRIYLEYPESSD